jgi:hypothetical protein
MQIIDPSYITEATLVSSDLPEVEAGYPEWDAGTEYMTGQRVSVTDTGIHKQYECLWGTGSTNKYPPDNLSGTPTYWLELSATNRWRLFDLIVAPARATASGNVTLTVWDTGIQWEAGTAWSTDAFSSLSVTILPGQIDTVALINVDATAIVIILTDPSAGEVYNEVKVPTVATNYNAIYSDIPAYPNATLQVTVRNTSGMAAAGELIVGTVKTLGTLRYGIGIGLVDFSQKTADEFGNFYIVERAYSKRVDCTFSMPTLTHAGIMRILEKYRTTPLVWILDDGFSTLVAYGYYRDFRIRIPNLQLAECSLSIEGLGGDLIRATPVPDPWVDPWDGIIRLDVTDIFHSLWDNAVAVSTAKIEEAPVTEDVPGLTVIGLPTASAVARAYALIGDCTISNAAPAVVTKSSHGLVNDQRVRFRTTGTLPAPLAVDTDYFVENKADDTFNLTLTIAGSTVDTTTAGSGVHSLYAEV